ncbi:MAG: hypothetical protein D6778_03870, partial [Nitrospirae bacterium]
IVSIFLTVSLAHGSATLIKAYKEATKGSAYEALRTLKPFIPSPREKPLYYFTLGLAYKRTGNTEKAIDYLRRAYITAKDRQLRERALFLRADTYYSGGFFYEARSLFRVFINIFPESSLLQEAKTKYAMACLSVGQLADAMEVFRSVGDENIEALIGKAEVFHKTGFYETAQELYQRAIDKDWSYFKAHPERLYYLAENLKLLGKKDRARKLYYFLLDSPMRQWAFLSLALIDLAEGKGHDAVLHLRMALQEPPNRPKVNPWQIRQLYRKVLLAMGRAYILEGDHEKAKRVLLKLREDFFGTPEAEEGLVLLAWIYTEEGRFIDATSFLREVLYGRTHRKEALEQLKTTILKAKDKDPEAFVRVWQMAGGFLYDETFVNELISIGRALSQAGHIDSIRVYQFVLERAETGGKREALKHLAEVFIKTRSVQGLRFVVQKMKQFQVPWQDYLRAKVWLLGLSGNSHGAYKLFKMLKNYKKDDLELLRRIASGAGDYEEFVRLYMKVSKEVKGPPDYRFLAHYAMVRKRPEEAVKYFQLYAKANPEATEPFAMVGVLKNKTVPLTAGQAQDLWSSVSVVLNKENEVLERLKRL